MRNCQKNGVADLGLMRTIVSTAYTGSGSDRIVNEGVGGVLD